MKLKEKIKRKFDKKSPHTKWYRIYGAEGTSWNNEYEKKGDLALYHHEPKKAIKYYTIALQTLGRTIFKAEKPEVVRVGQEIYGTIERKRTRVERAFYGERKYLSGKGREHRHEQGLASKIAGVVGLIALGGAALFAYSSVTANAIGNLPTKSTNILGVVLLFIGLAGAFAYFKFK